MVASSEQRSAWVADYEGRHISQVGAHGIEMAADHAECVIDGTMNALIRLKGREHAAMFGYAVADRAASGLREPTEIKFLRKPSGETASIGLLTFEASRTRLAWAAIVLLLLSVAVGFR
jgi:hypothetical protein